MINVHKLSFECNTLTLINIIFFFCNSNIQHWIFNRALDKEIIFVKHNIVLVFGDLGNVRDKTQYSNISKVYSIKLFFSSPYFEDKIKQKDSFLKQHKLFFLFIISFFLLFHFILFSFYICWQSSSITHNWLFSYINWAISITTIKIFVCRFLKIVLCRKRH